MNINEQIMVIFYSFIYGMFYLSTLRYYRKIEPKNLILKYLLGFIFMLLHTTLFYVLLYKLNNGMLSIYIVICFVLGCFFCHFLYFGDKKS